MIKKVKNDTPWTHVINDINGEEIIGEFDGKELQTTNQEWCGIKKKLRKKEISCMLDGKDMTIHLIAGLIKTILDKNE